MDAIVPQNTYRTYKWDTQQLLFWIIHAFNSVLQSSAAAEASSDEQQNRQNVTGQVTVRELVAMARTISGHAHPRPRCHLPQTAVRDTCQDGHVHGFPAARCPEHKGRPRIEEEQKPAAARQQRRQARPGRGKKKKKGGKRAKKSKQAAKRRWMKFRLKATASSRTSTALSPTTFCLSMLSLRKSAISGCI